MIIRSGRCNLALASCLLCLFFLFSPLALAQSDALMAQLDIPRLDQAPGLADFRGMQAATELARQMRRVEGFVQREPADGAIPSQRTEVYMGYDQRMLHVVYLAFDSNPDQVRANLASRENIDGDDLVELVIDTFNDQRTAYAFRSSPLGIQWDARWTEGALRFDTSWDAVWYSDGELTDQGYMVRISVPLQGLRFPDAEEQLWRIQLGRQIPRLSEEMYWPAYSLRQGGRLNQTALLSGIRDVSPGNNWQFIPYVFGRSVDALDTRADGGPRMRSSTETEIGLDAKFVFNDAWVLDITLNPDFSQVESDQPQVTVNQRFEVQFPERRPFFVENADFFATDSVLVFTRRIVDPEGGMRFTGRSGPWGLGAIVMNDQAPGLNRDKEDPLRGAKANIGIVRGFRDLGGQNRVGFLVTDRELADGYNRVASVDGRFRLNDNWFSTVQLVGTDTQPTLGDESFSGVQRNISFDRYGRTFSTHIHWLDTDPGFRTQLGFQNRFFRADTSGLHFNGRVNLYPENQALNRWGPSMSGSYLNDKDGVKIYRQMSPTMNWNFSATTVSVGYNDHAETLRPRDFAGLSQARVYSYSTWSATVMNETLSSLRVDLRYRSGSALNLVPARGTLPSVGDTQRVDVGVLWRPIERLRVDNTYLNTRLVERNGVKAFSNQIARSSWNYQFSREMSLRFIAQYEETSAGPATRLESGKNLNLDVLLRYVINPWSALYVGYNSNSRNFDIIDGENGRELIAADSLRKDGDQFFVKFSYLFQR